jgi:hypothetical protein
MERTRPVCLGDFRLKLIQDLVLKAFFVVFIRLSVSLLGEYPKQVWVAPSMYFPIYYLELLKAALCNFAGG